MAFLVDGALRITMLQPKAAFVANTTPEFSRGHRIELTPTTGCGFSVELRRQ